jgi:hypothetical protein
MEVIDISIKWPFKWCLVGSSGSGKTNFCLQIISNASRLLDTPPSKIVLLYKEFQNIYNQFNNFIPTQLYHEDEVDLEEITKSNKERLLVICDDLYYSKKLDEVAEQFLIKGRHRNTSWLVLTQSIFNRPALKNISRNSTHITLFKTVRLNEPHIFFSQLRPRASRVLQNIFAKATEKSFSYLDIDLSQTCPDKFRYKADIFNRVVSVFIIMNDSTFKTMYLLSKSDLYRNEGDKFKLTLENEDICENGLNVSVKPMRPRKNKIKNVKINSGDEIVNNENNNSHTYLDNNGRTINHAQFTDVGSNTDNILLNTGSNTNHDNFSDTNGRTTNHVQYNDAGSNTDTILLKDTGSNTNHVHFSDGGTNTRESLFNDNRNSARNFTNNGVEHSKNARINTLDKYIPNSNAKATARVIYSFEPAEPDELRLISGEYLTINPYPPHTSTWWSGTNSNGQTGLFPANHVAITKSVENRNNLQSPSSVGKRVRDETNSLVLQERIKRNKDSGNVSYTAKTNLSNSVKRPTLKYYNSLHKHGSFQPYKFLDKNKKNHVISDSSKAKHQGLLKDEDVNMEPEGLEPEGMEQEDIKPVSMEPQGMEEMTKRENDKNISPLKRRKVWRDIKTKRDDQWIEGLKSKIIDRRVQFKRKRNTVGYRITPEDVNNSLIKPSGFNFLTPAQSEDFLDKWKPLNQLKEKKKITNKRFKPYRSFSVWKQN